MNAEQIKALALENGFQLKEQPSGEMDLNPYVYQFAEALIMKAIPEGFILAPKEPEKEMYLAGTQALLEIDLSDVFDTDSIQVYKAMLSAIKKKGNENA